MKKRREPGKPAKASYHVERLEKRILFSADLPFIADGFTGSETDQAQLLTNADAEAPAEQSAIEARFELVIIDPSTPEYDSIVDDLQGRSDVEFEIYVLDPHQDGIAQIDSILARHENVSAMHLISHGEEGQVNLGNGAIGVVDLLADADTVAGWRDSFTMDADVLIYGCDLAANESGQNFVTAFGDLTGTDVAASTDVTGSVALGGDWDLEFETGSIETEVALSEQEQAQWTGVLATAVDDQYSVTEDDTLNADTTWFDSDWLYRRTLSFDNSARTENLTDFPVLIKLDASKIDYSKTHDQGDDLRFFDQDGNALAHEVETWDETGTSYVWVRVPQIDAGSDTDSILMYYGNASVTDDGQDSAGVWADYRAVYHLNENPGATGTVTDSAGNFDATNAGTTDTAGWVGNAQDFNGTDQQINLGDDRDWINNATGATLSIWMNPDTVSGAGDLLGVSRNDPADTGASRITLIRNGDDIQMIARSMDDSSDVASVVTTSNPLSADQWHHVTGTVDYSSNIDNIKIYVDGVLEGTFSHDFTLDAVPNTDSSHAGMGSDEDGVSAFFDGQLDEARIAAEARSADWVSAQYDSMTDNFVTFGYEQTAAGVLANDVDPEGDALTLTEVNGSPASYGVPTALASGALLTMNADGSFFYDPNGSFEWLAAGDSVDETFTYTVDDGNGNTDSATVTITVNGVNDAPVDLVTSLTTQGGVRLNADGGNDAYLVADDGGGLLGGLTTVTIETSFSITTPGADLSPLLSYAAGSNDEALALFLKNDGRIWFGVDSDGSPIASTTGTYPQLFDGNVHHVAVSWDSAGGAVDFYVDGQLVESITGYQTGSSVAGGGELVFGQDQDSVLGGFRTIDVFSGTLYDVRIFNDVRTPAEIAASYDQTLPNTEPGMIANWRFFDLLSGGVVTESVSGNNLTEAHVSGAGFSSSGVDLTLAVREDALAGAMVGRVLAIDPDVGDTFTYTLLDDANGRFEINPANGQITVADPDQIDFETDTSHDITVRVTDAGSLTYDEVFTIEVINVNESGASPIVDADAAPNSVAEDAGIGTAVGITAASDDADAGDTITYTLDDDAGGRFAIDSNSGVVTVDGALDRETDASHDITVRATSTDGSSTTQGFTIAVDDVNDTAPVITPGQTFDVDEDAAVNDVVGTVAAADADTVGALQGWTITAGNDDGVFQIDGASGEISIADTANLNFEETSQYTLTVQVGDGVNASTPETIVIDINDVNEAPAFTSTPVTVASEDTPYSYTITTDDVDGDAVSISGVTLPGWLTLIDNGDGTATLSGTPTDADVGDHTVELEVSDGGLMDTQSFTLTVGNVNDDPTFTSPGAFGVAENNTLVGTVTSSDVDGGLPRYTLVGGVDDGLFSIDLNTGVLTFNTAPDFESPADAGADNVYDITVQVDDGNGGIVTQNVAVTVSNVNEHSASAIGDAEVAANFVDEDAGIGAAVGITASSSDADAGDTVTYTLDDDAGGLFSIDANSGVVTVSGSLDYETATSHTITVRATSTDTSSSTRSFTIAVGDVNDNAPVVNPGQSFAVSEDAIAGDVVGVVGATDADTVGTLQGWSITGGNTDGVFQIDAATGEISVANTANLDFEATSQYTLTVQVNDGVANSATETVVIDVLDANENPAALNLSGGSVDEGTDTSAGYSVGVVTAADPDAGDAVTFSLVGGLDVDVFQLGGPQGNELIINDGILDFEAQNSYEVTVRATDDDGLFTDRTFYVTVNDLNDAPVAVGDALVALEDTPLTIDVARDVLANDQDPDADGLAVSSVGQPAHGILLDNTDGTWTYIPDSDYAGPDQIHYQVTDPAGATSWATIEVQVQAINDAPVITAPAELSGGENSTDVLARIQASDVENDSVTVAISGGADSEAFQLDAETGEISFAEGADFESPADADGDNRYELELTATDSAGASTTHTLDVRVVDVNEAPSIVSTDFVSEEQSAGAIGHVQIFDPDAGDSATLTIVGGSGEAAFAVDSETGAIIQKAPTGQGTYSLEIQVTDAEGASSTGTVEISVLPTELPVEDGDAPEVVEDTGVEVPAETPDTDEPEVGAASSEDADSPAGTEPPPETVSQADVDEPPARPAPADPGSYGAIGGEPIGAVPMLPSEDAGSSARGYEFVLDIVFEQPEGLAATFNEPMPGMEIADVSVALPSGMVEALAGMHSDIDEQGHLGDRELEVVMGSGAVATLSLTAGFVAWLLRAGSLLATAASTTPLWRSFDPIPVLAVLDGDAENEDEV